jgi:hypothetical protein
MPVLKVRAQVNLFCGPEAGFMFFVHLPDTGIVDGKDHKPVFILLQQHFVV